MVNGASIPKRVWDLVGGPWSGKYRNASVIHDWMCQTQAESWQVTHALFKEAMLTSGVDPLKADVMYAAVILGGPRWEPNQFAPTEDLEVNITAEQMYDLIEKAEEKYGRKFPK